MYKRQGLEKGMRIRMKNSGMLDNGLLHFDGILPESINVLSILNAFLKCMGEFNEWDHSHRLGVIATL